MKRLFLLAAMYVFSILSGCAAVTEFIDDNESTAQFAVEYTTIKVIDGDADRAARVIEIASQVQRYAGEDLAATVDGLIELARDEIRWDKLDEADTRLANYLLNAIAEELKDRLTCSTDDSGEKVCGDDVIPAELRVTVDKLATWVINAARDV